jgi:hypothetical protein
VGVREERAREEEGVDVAQHGRGRAAGRARAAREREPHLHLRRVARAAEQRLRGGRARVGEQGARDGRHAGEALPRRDEQRRAAGGVAG